MAAAVSTLGLAIAGGGCLPVMPKYDTLSDAQVDALPVFLESSRGAGGLTVTETSGCGSSSA